MQYHTTLEELDEFYYRSISAEGYLRVATHLESCDVCYGKLCRKYNIASAKPSQCQGKLDEPVEVSVHLLTTNI
jgi:hypothetical protein